MWEVVPNIRSQELKLCLSAGYRAKYWVVAQDPHIAGASWLPAYGMCRMDSPLIRINFSYLNWAPFVRRRHC